MKFHRFYSEWEKKCICWEIERWVIETRELSRTNLIDFYFLSADILINKHYTAWIKWLHLLNWLIVLHCKQNIKMVSCQFFSALSLMSSVFSRFDSVQLKCNVKKSHTPIWFADSHESINLIHQIEMARLFTQHSHNFHIFRISCKNFINGKIKNYQNEVNKNLTKKKKTKRTHFRYNNIHINDSISDWIPLSFFSSSLDFFVFCF